MSAPAASTAPALPWLPRETRWVLAVGGVCLILLTVCWYRSAGEGATDEQLPWLNVGAGAVALYWILSGRTLARARRRVATRRQVQFAALTQSRWVDPVARATPAEVGAGDVVIAAGMTRAHRGNCPLVEGKSTQPAPAGARMCGICG